MPLQSRASWHSLFLVLIGLCGAGLVGSNAMDHAWADTSVSSPEQGEWQKAQDLYADGKFEEALQALRAHPTESAQYFYNLGTVHLQLGRPGVALAYLEKANLLRPHDPQTRNNLQLTETALGRLIGKDRLDPASTQLEEMADRVSMDEIRSALGLLGLITAIFWLRSYWKTRNLKRTVLQPAGLFGVLGFALILCLYLVERVASSHPPAFLLERQIIRSGPGEQFIQLTQLEAGVKIRILGPESAGWRQVRYSREGGIGWVSGSSLLLL